MRTISVTELLFGVGVMLLIAALCLVLAGCDGKSLATAPGKVAASSPAVAGSACPVNILVWTLDKDMSGAHVTLHVDQPATRFLVREEQQYYSDGVSTELTNSYTFTGHFDRSYMAWALVNGCWSEPFEFYIGPENVDASDQISQNRDNGWGPETCTPQSFGFWDGASIELPVQARTALRVRYGDPNHRAGYQVGQQEFLTVAWTDSCREACIGPV